jgi:TIR domain/FHA domain
VSATDIFLSYSREDRSAARHFAESFAQEGFTVWWDAALRSGQTFDEVIEKELRAAKAVVVLWSPRSVLSRWVRAEATLADRRNKLVPAIIEACDRPIIFELTHAADLADWTGDTTDVRWRTLVNDLRRLVGGADEEAVAPPPAVEPAAKLTPATAESAAPRAAEPPRAEPKPIPTADDPLFTPARLSKNLGSDRVAPARLEENPTQFYERSDAFRQNEGDTVHCLWRLDGEVPETRFAISPSGLRIGRTAPADIIVAGAGVSRAHCLVELAGDQIRVSDLNSTNGTYIDNKRIGRAAILPIGSVVRVGNVSFEHEVRPRSELEQQDDPASFGRPNPRLAGLARSS